MLKFCITKTHKAARGYWGILLLTENRARPEGEYKRNETRRRYSLTANNAIKRQKRRKKYRGKNKNVHRARRCGRRSSSARARGAEAIKYVKRCLKRPGEIFSKALPLQIRPRGLACVVKARSLLAETAVVR